MRRKILLIAGLCLSVSSFAMAEGFELQLGVGYHATFFRQSPNPQKSWFFDDADLNGDIGTINVKHTPVGLGSYIGLGYGIGSSQDFSLGIESALSLSMSVDSSPVSNLGLQGRLFAKYGPSEIFSITGFGGLKGSLLVGSKIGFPLLSSNTVFGIRTTISFFYLEYAVAMEKKFTNIYSHDISLGVSLIND